VKREFDIIVVGGGHAGTEAAAAAARMGASGVLVSFDRAQIGAMSCNPAMGGLGKGHLIREVDAFDGLIARASDHAAIHYRMLNASKGAAVRGPRIQADRKRYRHAIHALIEAQPGIEVVEGEAAALRLEERRVTGLDLADGRTLACDVTEILGSPSRPLSMDQARAKCLACAAPAALWDAVMALDVLDDAADLARL